MHDTDDCSTSPATGPHLDDILRLLSRRRFIGGTVVAVATGFLGGSRLAGEWLAGTGDTQPSTGRLTFAEVPPSTADTLVVPRGYTWAPLAPWGTPLLPGAPPFAEDASNTAEDQARQVGFNHDGMAYFPQGPDGDAHGLLVVNHEYTDASQIYSAAQGRAITPDAAGRAKVAKALAAHGVSVMVIRR